MSAVASELDPIAARIKHLTANQDRNAVSPILQKLSLVGLDRHLEIRPGTISRVTKSRVAQLMLDDPFGHKPFSNDVRPLGGLLSGDIDVHYDLREVAHMTRSEAAKHTTAMLM